jgi:hypothetical protein
LDHSSKEAEVVKTYHKNEISALTGVKINYGKTECDGHNPSDLHTLRTDALERRDWT